jgi:hypothetical protein
MHLSSHQRRIAWFVVLVVLTIVFSIAGVELGQTGSGVGYLMLIFGLPLAIFGLGFVGYSLSHEK